MTSIAFAVPARLQVVGAVLLALLLGLLAQDVLVGDRERVSGVVIWVAAAVAFLYALRGAPETAEIERAEAEASIPLRLEVVLFCIVLAVGALFRLYKIESIPAGLNHDAAWEGLYAVRINQGIHYEPFVACCGSFGRETMFFYVIAFFQQIAGVTALAIELASTTGGVATLVVFYLLVRKLFGPRVALVAMLLLAVSGWHLTFSRVGWRAILVPFFEALAVYLLLVAIDSRKLVFYVLAGIALGLSLDTYEAARMIPVGVAIFLVYLAITNRDSLRTQIAGLVGYAAAAVIAFAPLGWYILHHWDAYSGRSRGLWVGHQIKEAGSIEPLLRNLFDGVLIFNYRAHGDDFFINDPLLDLPISIFFVLGLVYSLTRLRERSHVVLLILLAVSLTNGLLSVPNGNRGIGAVIPVMAYAGLFLVVAWRWLVEAYSTHAAYFDAALAGVLLLCAYVTYDTYLGPDRRDQWGFYPETTRVGRYMKSIAPEYEIHAAAGNWPRDALTYLSYQEEGDPFKRVYTYTANAVQLLSIAPSAAKGTAYIVEATSQNEPVFSTLRQRFPTARTDEILYARARVANVLLVPRGVTPLPDILPPPEVLGQDARRRSDLKRVAAALAAYQERTGAYPNTDGNVQTACVFLDLDKLCVFREQLGRQTLTDPRGDGTRYGYWYASDGKAYALFATFESPVPPAETCRPADRGLSQKPNLYCLLSD